MKHCGGLVQLRIFHSKTVAFVIDTNGIATPVKERLVQLAQTPTPSVFFQHPKNVCV
jgi:hypothetical protein